MKRNDKEELELTKSNLIKTNIEFLCQSENSSATLNKLRDNSLASIRLRTALAASAAKALNWHINLSNGKKMNSVDILLIGKVDPNCTNEWYQRAKKVKKSKGLIIIDYTDNHLESDTPVGNFYRKVIGIANVVICSSKNLQESVAKFSNIRSVIIEEPIEVPIISPINKENSVTTILWFGHASNLTYLIECLFENFSNCGKAKLILMSNACPLPENIIKILDNPQLDNLEINVIPWTKNDMLKAAQISDFCIIPTGYKDERKKGASSNRLITSLAMGLPTLTDQLESYKPFKKFFKEINKNNIKEMISNPIIDENLQLEAQEIISVNYNFEKITNDWISVFKDIKINNNPTKKSTGQIKLNLGCGDKIIDGYINVDVVAIRAGKEPDVICDLHDLHVFDSNSADEILAVHVVEHFWQWEVTDILKEWIRVLKPGGKMILECPNLISAAEEFLKNPDIAAMGGKEGQRSMWVFYGDPAWKDPLMIHRWGYTPRSLATVMNSAGLTNLRQEPAQFKLREPRDMRITGLKPLNNLPQSDIL